MTATVQIFLSYARLDAKQIENLYQRLSDAGFKPWMDKKDLVGGERWKASIQKAIRGSDFFLTCLSTNSVTKRGFLQREIRYALDIVQEKLNNDIYLIPVRLDNCEVPEDLSDFQWINLFEEDGWTRLVKAIQAGIERGGERLERPPVVEPQSLARPSIMPNKDKSDTTVGSVTGQRVVVVRDLHGNIIMERSSRRSRSRPKGDTPSRKKVKSLTKTRKIPRKKGDVQPPAEGAKRLRKAKEPEFANRDKELDYLEQEKYDFYLIYAPAGYGKSRLLGRLQENFEDKKWKVVLLDFEDEKNKSARTSTSKVLSRLLEHVKAGLYEYESDKDRIGRFAKAITQKRPVQALLIFDTLEYASGDVFTWIRDTLLPGLGGRPRIEKLRAFFACRFDIRLRGGGSSTGGGIHLQPYPLSHFHEDDLMLVVRKWAPSLTESERTEIAKCILELTRGHPRCFTNVLIELEKSGFTHRRANGRFRETDRRELFQECVEPVVREEILADATQYLRLDALQVVFTFRRVSSILVELLKDDSALRPFDLSKPFSGEQFFRNYLYPTGLLAPPVKHDIEWPITDPVVRHFFAVDMQINDRERFRSLHSFARSHFLDWFKGLGLPQRSEGSAQNRYFIEALYHLCRELEASDLEPEDNRRRVMEEIQVWKEYSNPGFGSTHVAQAEGLLRMLDDEDEVDLPTLLDTLTGVRGFQGFKSALSQVALELDNDKLQPKG